MKEERRDECYTMCDACRVRGACESEVGHSRTGYEEPQPQKIWVNLSHVYECSYSELK